HLSLLVRLLLLSTFICWKQYAMQILDNVNQLFGDDLKKTITPNAKLKIAASCFSIYAYAALKKELNSIESLEFIFTSPTFVPEQATDKLKKEQAALLGE